MNRFVVMESAAQVRGKMRDFGRYRRIAVVELTLSYAETHRRPLMISSRARGVARIVKEWSPMHQGKTERSEYYVALKAATELAGELNAQKGGD